MVTRASCSKERNASCRGGLSIETVCDSDEEGCPCEGCGSRQDNWRAGCFEPRTGHAGKHLPREASVWIIESAGGNSRRSGNRDSPFCPHFGLPLSVPPLYHDGARRGHHPARGTTDSARTSALSGFLLFLYSRLILFPCVALQDFRQFAPGRTYRTGFLWRSLFGCRLSSGTPGVLSRKRILRGRTGNANHPTVSLSGSAQLGQHALGLFGALLRGAFTGVTPVEVGVWGGIVCGAYFSFRAIQGGGPDLWPLRRPDSGCLDEPEKDKPRKDGPRKDEPRKTSGQWSSTHRTRARARLALRCNFGLLRRTAQPLVHAGGLVLATRALFSGKPSAVRLSELVG